jgi:hypothetical protein
MPPIGEGYREGSAGDRPSVPDEFPPVSRYTDSQPALPVPQLT